MRKNAANFSKTLIKKISNTKYVCVEVYFKILYDLINNNINEQCLIEFRNEFNFVTKDDFNDCEGKNCCNADRSRVSYNFSMPRVTSQLR